ncbi:DNA repair protein RadA [Saprospira grandis DSM 2844]|uniref:DNA repair protein RadA n=1 Tax=Saprospira grandis DSM 2844 TaxID=694433 RepID=J1I6S2_9BACT|nr:DNA repair protein RadA [Saprospira grandis]EJF54510.1 DNA repair protein RadA [Saprospira grandis DSM 2844]
MAKTQKTFVCTECGNVSLKWEGRCSACGEWNSLQEEVTVKGSAKQEAKKATQGAWTQKRGRKQEHARPTHITKVQGDGTVRRPTDDEELNRVLGGGIVSGSIVLIGGEPGVGKSTLMLQLALSFSGKVLYVSGEESEQQIKMRAERLGLRDNDCFLMAETNLTNLLMQAATLGPDVLVVDSIQTLSSQYVESPPGSVSQVRECASELQRFAKETNIPVFVIGHINKDGAIAGPKLLEHIVDVVLQFEGDRNYTHRILRTIKNRFGSTAELGIYEMQGRGLREVSNPSELLLTQKEEDLSGSAITATVEGIRPMLIEIQALVSTSVFSSPQRSATGFDLRRLSMLLAVLEKRCGFQFGNNDVFLNVAGGLKVSDPAIDMAVVAALLSSLEDVAMPSNVCFAGEIGLSGEIRSVQRIDQRIQEANRLGFEKIYVSKFNTKGIDPANYDIEIVPLSKVEQLFEDLFQ